MQNNYSYQQANIPNMQLKRQQVIEEGEFLVMYLQPL